MRDGRRFADHSTGALLLKISGVLKASGRPMCPSGRASRARRRRNRPLQRRPTTKQYEERRGEKCRSIPPTLLIRGTMARSHVVIHISKKTKRWYRWSSGFYFFQKDRFLGQGNAAAGHVRLSAAAVAARVPTTRAVGLASDISAASLPSFPRSRWRRKETKARRTGLRHILYRGSSAGERAPPRVAGRALSAVQIAASRRRREEGPAAPP